MLISDDFQTILLCDLGEAIIAEKHEKAGEGTIMYRAPDDAKSFKSDMW